MEISPIVIVLGAFGIVLNLLFSGGALYKLIDFASDYGATKQKVNTLHTEQETMRDHYHDKTVPRLNNLDVRLSKLEARKENNE